MKTAVSLPDDLFDAAEALARRLGVSRSKLFATALSEYVAKHRRSRVTERLNAVYGPDEPAPDPDVRRAARRTARRQEW